MPPETEVISCPACNHLLRVPADWLGTQVQCPECRAMFNAPVRDGDRLTEPVLISRPADAVAPERRGKLDAMLLMPAFALMFLSVASLVVNAVTLYDITSDTAAFEEGKRAQLEKLAPQLGQDPQAIGGIKWEFFAAASGWGLLCAAIAFLGGLGMARRRWYRLACAGCVTAALNVPACCCLGGVPVGIWGLLMLLSSEGRAHFGR